MQLKKMNLDLQKTSQAKHLRPKTCVEFVHCSYDLDLAKMVEIDRIFTFPTFLILPNIDEEKCKSRHVPSEFCRLLTKKRKKKANAIFYIYVEAKRSVR